MSPALATSQLIATTLRPGAPASICDFASASAPWSRARIATSAPEAAYSCAIARPSPLLPPVTIALLPSNRISMITPSQNSRRPLPARALLCRDAVDFVHVLARQAPPGRRDIGRELLRRGRARDDARHHRTMQ